MAKFVHLHTHSHYSLLDGLGKIPELVSRAKELGMEAMALTDHGSMYGVINFYKECKNQGIKPIIGVETYVSPRRMEDKVPRIDAKPFHLILLAKNIQGYKNLLHLVTQAHLRGHYYRPRVDKELLKQYSEGLIASTACAFGEIPQTILGGNWAKVLETTKIYQNIFGKDNFYLELQDHPEFAEQKTINEGLKKLSEELKIPLICTADIHYIKPEDRDAHEVLLAVQTGKNLDDESRMSLKETDLSVRPAEEFEKIFGSETCENTVKIANKCNLELKFGDPILPKFILPEGETPKTYLEKLAWKGLKERYSEITPVIEERLKYELATIEKTNFEDYLLIVADYVNFAKTHEILVGPGRGSAAGSLVCYALNITDIDPLEYNLLFERFLNPERIAPPDIDLDFADARRDEVIKYISQKYGAENVAQIITFGTMASRGSVRDTGRALGITYSDVDKIAKLIPFGLSLSQSLEAVDELKDLYNQDPQVKRLLDMAQRLEGVARHASTHAAGIVIARDGLENYVPLQFAPRGNDEIITQYAMNEIEAIGLIKMDILGLANLSIMGNALKIIRKTQNQEINIDKLPLDDKETYKLLSRAETTGVFQLESDGMKRYLKELKPTVFKDIIAMVALYRPGPIGLIPDYIDGKHKRKKITYLHPKLEPILKDTYGIAVYQEQVLQIARDIAGFSLGEADILRKAVGKKIKKLLMEQKLKFIEGAVKNDVSRQVAEKLFAFIEPFAEYGFNKAHAKSCAKIAYQTAYLKTHFPLEYMAALMTSEQNNLDKLSVAINECERMRIKVLPPEVNESFVDFGVVQDTNNIRFGLAAIKNVGAGVAEAIVDNRKTHGPFSSFEDFLTRLTNKILNKKVIESLAKAGALDNFAERNQILASIETILKFIGQKDTQDQTKQMGLFKKTTVETAKLTLTESEPATKKQRLAWEKELLGMYVSEHPLKGMEGHLKNFADPISTIDQNSTGKKVKVAGIITHLQKIITKSNEPMLFATVEDTSARTEVLVFPKVLQKNTLIWQTDNIILVEGRTNTKDGTLKIIAETVKEVALEQTIEQLGERLLITIPPKSSREILVEIKNILAKFPGEISVFIKIPQNGQTQEIKTKTRVANDQKLIDALNLLVGKDNIVSYSS
ncbi:MAG: polymerase alpha subunit [Candidatus Berkelbacteria bacterium]|nr:polymerase alpha subunit [Candidatus Berkelbacteria bacterium]